MVGALVHWMPMMIILTKSHIAMEFQRTSSELGFGR